MIHMMPSADFKSIAAWRLWRADDIGDDMKRFSRGKWLEQWKTKCWLFHSYVGVSLNGGFSPQIIHFNRVFHYKPSILGYHHFRKPPYWVGKNLSNSLGCKISYFWVYLWTNGWNETMVILWLTLHWYCVLVKFLNMRGWHCTSARLAAIRQSTSIWGSFFCWGHGRWFFQGINLQSTVRAWYWFILSFFWNIGELLTTLPETNSFSLKIGKTPKRKLIFQPSIFRGEHVKFQGW